MQSQVGITSNERDCTLGGGEGVILGRPQHFGVGNLCCHVLLIKKRNEAFENRKNEKEHPVLPHKAVQRPWGGGQVPRSLSCKAVWEYVSGTLYSPSPLTQQSHPWEWKGTVQNAGDAHIREVQGI